MNYQLIYRAEAKKDLADIEIYYNAISTSLTKRFFSEFFETIQFIEQEPQLF